MERKITFKKVSNGHYDVLVNGLQFCSVSKCDVLWNAYDNNISEFGTSRIDAVTELIMKVKRVTGIEW